MLQNPTFSFPKVWQSCVVHGENSLCCLGKLHFIFQLSNIFRDYSVKYCFLNSRCFPEGSQTFGLTFWLKWIKLVHELGVSSVSPFFLARTVRRHKMLRIENQCQWFAALATGCSSIICFSVNSNEDGQRGQLSVCPALRDSFSLSPLSLPESKRLYYGLDLCLIKLSIYEF